MNRICAKPIVLLITVAVVLTLCGGTFFSYKMGWFVREPLGIENTANVVEEVKKIGEFTSACYYEEMALRDKYTEKTLFISQTNEILLICKGCVRAGFDLGKVQEEDIYIQGDTLKMRLPQVEPFDIIMNPSDFTTEYEKGTWSHELTKPIKERARTELEKNAIKSGILEKAEKNGIDRLTKLFQTLGFGTVILNVSQPDATE